jgi:hypothetical protein
LTNEADYLGDHFLDRVKRAYRIAHGQTTIDSNSLWVPIMNLQGPIHTALMTDNNDALRSIFIDPYESDLYYGMDQLSVSADNLVDRTGVPDFSIGLVSLIITLADAIGLRRWLPQGSEQEVNYPNIMQEPRPDIDKLLDRIAGVMGYDIRFPSPFPDEKKTGGMMTARGLATYRAIQALYQSYRVAQELLGDRSKSILEIGPGMGRTAYYCWMAGFRDYTTMDIPMGIVAQARFMAAVLGAESIWLPGDPPNTQKGRMCLLPSSARSRSANRFALVLNVDSITETAGDSEVWAAWIAKHADVFLSINHEANSPTVANLGRRYFAGALSHRFQYWLRHGYVEEIFRFEMSPRKILPPQRPFIISEIARLLRFIRKKSL